jgi:hypothetical protein
LRCVVLQQDPRDLFDLIEVVGTGTYGEVHKVCNGTFPSVVVRLAYALLFTVTKWHLWFAPPLPLVIVSLVATYGGYCHVPNPSF